MFLIHTFPFAPPPPLAIQHLVHISHENVLALGLLKCFVVVYRKPEACALRSRRSILHLLGLFFLEGRPFQLGWVGVCEVTRNRPELKRDGKT